jgi:hypothetical protein
MAYSDAGGNSAKYETTHVSFFPVEVNGETRQLFAICEGIPVGPVLKQVISLLTAAYLSNDYLSKTRDPNGDVALALGLQLEVARALVESLNRSMKG